MELDNKKRKSGFELVKIIAIFLIVLAHTSQTLSSLPTLVPGYEYGFDGNMATQNMNQFLVIYFRYGGALGNDIFLCCSAWFLLDTNKVNYKKILKIVGNVWNCSVILLIVFSLLHISIPKNLVIRSVFPTIFGNNWYITCYLLLYVIHPYLNIIIEHMNHIQYIKLLGGIVVLYFGAAFVKQDLLFSSELIYFICIYFIIGYIKKYVSSFFNKRNILIFCIVVGIMTNFTLVYLTNYLGLRNSYLQDKLLMWENINNPFIVIVAIGILGSAVGLSFYNGMINSISRVSIYIYILHENIIFRQCIRWRIWVYLLNKYPRAPIVILDIAFAVVLFCASTLLAFAYCNSIKIIFEKNVDYIIGRLESRKKGGNNDE